MQGHTQAITQIDYSGDRVVSLAGDGIRVWDLKYDTKYFFYDFFFDPSVFSFSHFFFPAGLAHVSIIWWEISLHASSLLVQMNCYRLMLKVMCGKAPIAYLLAGWYVECAIIFIGHSTFQPPKRYMGCVPIHDCTNVIEELLLLLLHVV